MSLGSLHRSVFALLFGVVLLFASCGKEVVEPCQKEPDGGDAKSLMISHPGEGQGSTSSTDGDEEDGKGSTIGDDGDDLPDTERGRRKKTS